MKEKRKIFDSIVAGLIPGLIVPLITAYIFFLSKDVYGVQTFKGFIHQVVSYGIVSQLLSICLLGNLAIFFLNIWTKRYRASRGVILATMIYGIVILVYKFVL